MLVHFRDPRTAWSTWTPDWPPDDTASLLGCCIFRWYANRQGQENIEGESTSYCRRNSRSPQGFDPRPIIELEKYQTLCSR